MPGANRVNHGWRAPGRREGAGRSGAGSPALIVLAMASLGAGPEVSRFEFRQTHMGSEFKVVLYTDDEGEARRASDSAFARIASLDRALSDYDPESELMRLCDRAGEGEVPVSPDLLLCLQSAQAMARRSDGAFDPTIGPVGRLWRRARRDHRMPGGESLERAKRLVGYRMIQINAPDHAVSLEKAGMKLDLGGIAKGFACDRAMLALRREGIASALVAGAGDIVVSDPPPGRQGWRIGVAEPDGDPDRPSRFLALANAAVSTSGDAERFVEIDGKRYSHIVDPRTGLGVIDRASVTVVAPDGATADSLGTAVFVLGPEEGLGLADRIDGAAALYVGVGDPPKVAFSDRWTALARDPETNGPRTNSGGPR